MNTLAHIRISPEATILNNKVIASDSIVALYRRFVGDYPKFFKMDSLCKLGFVAAELLLRDLSPEVKENAAILLFNRNASLITDRAYQKTINDPDNFFPSPALFVYTLANIVTGEIAIRHKIYGETSFIVIPEFDQNLIDREIANIFLSSQASPLSTPSSFTSPSCVLAGWVDFNDDTDYLADLKVVTI